MELVRSGFEDILLVDALPPRVSMLTLTLKHPLLRIDGREAEGSTYKLFNGMFGFYPNIVVKRTRIENRVIVLNDVKFMQKLSLLRMFECCHAAEEDSKYCYLAVEAFELDCLKWLKKPNASSPPGSKNLFLTYDPVAVVKGLFEAIKYLHNRGMSHGSIQAKNTAIQIENGESDISFSSRLLYFLIFSGGWRVILCGMKYAQQVNSNATVAYRRWQKRPADYPTPSHIKDRFSEDQYQMAVFVYHVVRHVPPGRSRFELEIEWPPEPYVQYKKVHLKHLACCMLGSTLFTIEEYLGHPAFMTPTEMVAFEDRLYTFTKETRSINVQKELANGQNVVFVDDWAKDLEEPIKLIVEGKKLDMAGNVIPDPAARTYYRVDSIESLWALKRNRRAHREADSLAARALLGVIPDENVSYWQGKFPYFFIHLYFRLSTINMASGILAMNKELVTSYKTRSAAFYHYCESIPFISTPAPSTSESDW